MNSNAGEHRLCQEHVVDARVCDLGFLLTERRAHRSWHVVGNISSDGETDALEHCAVAFSFSGFLGSFSAGRHVDPSIAIDF